ncbi:family 1 glycosylhydrolase [Ligilactobacillus ruminis]|uniref:family 1 glycosylhydrolase n=1 Tax=Ligilactobacillus ruminis TaxID=1623 RepID=UPI003F973830
MQIGHKNDSENKIGCMIVRMQTYPKTRNQSDVRVAQLQDKSNLFFTDVQVCGEYPKYLNRYFKENGIELSMEPEDEAEIKKGTVDCSSSKTVWVHLTKSLTFTDKPLENGDLSVKCVLLMDKSAKIDGLSVNLIEILDKSVEHHCI